MKQILLIGVLASLLCSCAATDSGKSNGLWHPTASVPSPGPTPLGTPTPTTKPDKVVVDTEIALLSARDTFNYYVHFEKDNAAFLLNADPHFHEFANYLKLHAIGWLSKADQLKNAYKASKSLFDFNALQKQMTTIANEVSTTKTLTQKASNTTP